MLVLQLIRPTARGARCFHSQVTSLQTNKMSPAWRSTEYKKCFPSSNQTVFHSWPCNITRSVIKSAETIMCINKFPPEARADQTRKWVAGRTGEEPASPFLSWPLTGILPYSRPMGPNPQPLPFISTQLSQKNLPVDVWVQPQLSN